MIKLICKRCNKKISVPDDWAGRYVRCAGCNLPMKVPVPDDGPPPPKHGLLDQLAEAESGPRTAEAGEAAPTFTRIPRPSEADEAEARKPERRVCPHCGKPVTATDPSASVLCSHCWQPIPPVGADQQAEEAEAVYERVRAMEKGHATDEGFYSQVGSVFMYPIRALNQILLAAAVGTLPLALILWVMFMISAALRNEPVHGAQITFKWLFLACLIGAALDTVYWSGVAFFAQLDTIRSTAIGLEAPPKLSWDLRDIGGALANYVGFLAWYGLLWVAMVWGMLSITGHAVDDLLYFRLSADVQLKVLAPPTAILAALLPMALIGMASNVRLGGLNVYRVVQSIVRVPVHYVFLWCLCLILGAMVQACAIACGLQLSEMNTGETQTAAIMLGTAMATYIGQKALLFYVAFAVGRLCGLFARSFGKRLAFEF